MMVILVYGIIRIGHCKLQAQVYYPNALQKIG